jgi:Helix-turn-helix domain
VIRRLVKAPEIRKLLNLDSDSRVYDLARRGVLTGVVRLGRQVRFDLDKVLAFVDRGGQALSGGWRAIPDVERQGHQKQVSAPPQNDLDGGQE